MVQAAKLHRSSPVAPDEGTFVLPAVARGHSSAETQNNAKAVEELSADIVCRFEEWFGTPSLASHSTAHAEPWRAAGSGPRSSFSHIAAQCGFCAAFCVTWTLYTIEEK